MDEYLDVNNVYTMSFDASKIIQCKIFCDSPHVHIKFGIKPFEQFSSRSEKSNYLSIAFDLNKKSQKTTIAKRLFSTCKGDNNENFLSISDFSDNDRIFLTEKEPPKVFSKYPDIVLNN